VPIPMFCAWAMVKEQIIRMKRKFFFTVKSFELA
jgi:hypothetical protein